MHDKSVYLITELWVLPNSISKLKKYRQSINKILEKYQPEYIFYNHAFQWVYGGEGENLPSGIDIVKFQNEDIAQSAIAATDTPELKSMENEVFEGVRCYLSRHAFSENVANEIFS